MVSRWTTMHILLNPNDRKLKVLTEHMQDIVDL